MLDPRHFLFPHFLVDPHAAALLARTSMEQSTPGKILPSQMSFRIQDLLEAASKHDDVANTSGESLSEGADSEKPSGNDYLSSDSPHGSKKARKARTIFTDKQLQELESMFDKQKYLSVQDRMELAQRMGLSDTQVKTWYQNRRTKWKRQASVGMELLNEAGNMAAVQQLIRTNPYWAGCFGVIPQSTVQRFLPPGAFPLGTGLPGTLPTIADPSSPSPIANLANPLAMFAMLQSSAARSPSTETEQCKSGNDSATESEEAVAPCE